MLGQVDSSLGQSGPRTEVGKKVLIAVEHLLMGEAFEKILREASYDVLLANPNDVHQEIASFAPDIVVVELPLSQLHDLVCSERTSGHGSTRFVYLSVDISAQTAASAFRMGASAYVLKQAGVDEMLSALRNVADKRTYLSALIPKMDVKVLLNSRFRNRWDNPLTVRQREVLHLFARGMTIKEVASALNVSFGTITFHKYRIMEKLSFTCNTDFIRYGIMHRALR